MSVLVWWTVLLKGRVKGVRLGNVNWRRSVLSFPIVDEGGDTAGSNMVKGCVRNESSPGVMRDQVGNGDVQVGCGNLDVQYG
ncbi:hypothetical protein V6N12_058961 [Hibiscus sabdariffa]|uniref:Uncharacterized protein n=1 Tax=Hibiscus sabdariffa TaxID=183260 RepID=A0ABR2EVK3_9ROSI